MAGRDLNLGLGQQLQADELQRAYAALGGAPADLGQPVQAAPAPAPVPAAPLPDMSVQRARGRPAQELAEYVRGDLADQNEKIRLAQRGGVEESTRATTRAGMRQEQADAQKGYNEQARADAQETRGHRKGLREEQDRILEEMRANMSPPSKSAGEKVWGVLGGLLAMGSQGRAAAGVQLINSMVGSDRKERWAAEQQARSGLYNAVTRGIDLDNSSEEQQHEVARRMGAADALYWANAIEAEKERGMSDAMKREADGAVLELRQKARGLLRADAEKRQAQAAQAAKGRAKGEMDAKEQWFWNREIPELQQMPSSVLGEVGQKVLAEKIKRDQSFRGGEEEIAAKRAKNEAGPSANLSADERKVQRLLTGVSPSVQSLRQFAQTGGAPPHPYAEHLPDIVRSEDALNLQADMSAVADILLRDESGAAIGKDEQEKKLRGWGITSGDPQVRKRGLQKMLAEYDARLGAHGGGTAPPPPSQDPRVRQGFAGPRRGPAVNEAAVLDQLRAQEAQQQALDAQTSATQAAQAGAMSDALSRFVR